MTAEDQENIRNFVSGIAVSVMMMPSARDRQVALGPSDLADKCDVCLSRKIAALVGLGSPPARNFSMKAWTGTAVHEKLERDLPNLYRRAELELKVHVADIPGIGPVGGHIDLFLPDKKTCVDYKTTDLKKLKGYQNGSGPDAYTQGMTASERTHLKKLQDADRAGLLDDDDMKTLVSLSQRARTAAPGIPQEYLGQTMLYLYGLRASGREADYAVLVFIPRDSNNVNDIWVASCAYRQDVAEAVISRAARLAEMVRSGRMRELESHLDCFVCRVQPRLAR